MSDLADHAQNLIELALKYSLERYKKPNAPASEGKCLNCQEPIAPPQRWCDADCRNDWSKRHVK